MILKPLCFLCVLCFLSWLYRIRPTVGHSPFIACDVESGGAALASNLVVNDFSSCHVTPNQYRWRPFSMEHLVGPAAVAEKRKVDFLQGLATLAGQGSPDSKAGMAIHIYTCNASMDRKAFTNSDGDMLIVPQTGVLHIRTEMGMLRVAPGHIAVVQRGIAFSVAVTEVSRGYICEVRFCAALFASSTAVVPLLTLLCVLCCADVQRSFQAS